MNTAHLELETIEQGLRFRAGVGSGQSMVMDSGEGMVAPSPVEALLVALGACHGMDIISILRKKRQVVTSYTIDLEGDRRSEHPRSFTNIRIVHHLRGRDLSAAAVEEAIRLTDSKYCSVHRSLDPAIEITSRYEITPA
jgi:putative redox protein